MKTRAVHSLGRRGAFTLAEVMMATGVGTLLVMLTISAALAISRVYVRTGIKNSVSEDFRDFTRLMAEQGNQSNGYYIFEGIRPSEHRLCGVGESGDVVVFVYYALNSIKTTPNEQKVSRIIGFYRERAAGPAATAPCNIRWFDSAKHDWGHGISAATPVSIGAGASGLAALLPVPASASASAHAAPASVVGAFPVLALHTMGAAGSGGALRLFNNNDGKSLSVAGFIVRSTSTAGTDTSGYRSQNAFNLTIAPRSAN